MNNQVITINLVPNMSAPPVVKVSQGDIGRPILFNVLDGTSNANIVAYRLSARIVGTKPSGLGFSVDCTIPSNGVVSCETTLAMTQESGQIPAEIQFYYRDVEGLSSIDTTYGTANFILSVEPTPHPDGTTDGTTAEARTVLEQCQAAAASAQASAEVADEAVAEYVDEALPTVVDEWLTEHPEATTTAQLVASSDGSGNVTLTVASGT